VAPKPLSAPTASCLHGNGSDSQHGEDCGRFRVENPSPRTIEVYRESVKQFHAFLVRAGRSTEPRDTTRGDVADFFNDLAEAGRSPATRKTRFSALRRFYNWLVDEGEIEHSPMTRLRAPAAPDKPPEGLTDNELASLFATCNGSDFLARRDRAILRLFLDGGYRRTELATVLLANVRLDHQMVKTVSKGGDEDYIPLGDLATRDLDRYLRIRARHPDHNHANLWLGSPRGIITSNGIYQMIRRRMVEAGLDRKIHPHLFRHTFAHLLKSGGATDEEVQRLGRWKDAKMVRRYGAWAADQRAFATHRRLAPGDRIK
jgi:integrase/recombinase XerC